MTRPLAGALLSLAVVGVMSAVVFVHVMYDDEWTPETAIEAASYAAQTFTTVGYGNWESPAIQGAISIPNHDRRVLAMRGWSVLFMFLGATFYAVFTGIVVSILISPQTSAPRRP